MKGYSVSRKSSLIQEINSLPRYKEVFLALTWRNHRLQYNSPLLGVLWGIISPLLISSIFFIALNQRVGVDFSDYFVFLYSGFIFWNVFTASLGQASSSLVQNHELLKRVYFPKLLLPLSFIAAKLLDFTIAFILLTTFLAFSDLEFQWIIYISLSIVAIVCLILVSSGFCLLFSVLSVRFRGLQVIYPLIVQIIFFTSSVVYDSNLTVSEPVLRRIFQFNPITGVLNIFRNGIFKSDPHWGQISLYLFYSLAIFIIGYIWFRAEEKTVIDHL